MSRLISTVTGNFTAAATWGVVDTTSILEAESGPTNSTTSFVYSSTFVPGAITVDGVAVKIGNRVASPTGTMTIDFRNSTTATSLATIVINVSDIDNAGTGAYNRGWYFFKFAAPLLLVVAEAYHVGFRTSVISEVALYRDGTAGNWSRLLRTTTTAAPAAGDQIQVLGEFTGPGTGSTFTVTMDNTATTIFGALGTRTTIGKQGILSFGTAAATAYYFKWKGPFTVYGGGILRVGTSVSPIPATSTAVVEMDSSVNIDTGIEIGHGATVEAWGATQANFKTLLTTSNGGFCSTVGTAVTRVAGSQSFLGLTGTININTVNRTIVSVTDADNLVISASAGTTNNVAWFHIGTATVATVADTTGWAAGDQLAFASTTQVATDSEKKIILTVDSPTQVTLTVALAASHYGTSPMQAEVGNLTHNVKFRGITSLLQGYINTASTSIVTFRYSEFSLLGSGTGGATGIDVAVTTGTFDMQFCSRYDSTVASSRGVNITSASGNNITVSNNVFYNIVGPSIQNALTTGSYTINNNLIIVLSSGATTFNDHGIIITNNTFVGGISLPVSMTDTGLIGTFSGNTIHSFAGGSGGLWFSGASIAAGSVIANTTIWGGSSGTVGALRFNNFISNITINGLTTFYISTVHLGFNAGSSYITINNWTSNEALSTSGPASPLSTAINVVGVASSVNGPYFITNSNFSTVNGLLLANLRDISFTLNDANGQFVLANTILNGVTPIFNLINAANGSYVSSAKHQQVNAAHQASFPEGVTSYDAVIFDVTPSERLTPNNATDRLKSNFFFAAVRSGETCTPSVEVRESVIGDGTDYNGQRARLFVKANVAAGIAADTLLATATVASEGAWETLSGATIAVTDDAVLSFYVDCGGSGYTTGWVNIDTGSVVVARGTSGFRYWQDGLAVVDLGASEAGGGGASAYTYA